MGVTDPMARCDVAFIGRPHLRMVDRIGSRA